MEIRFKQRGEVVILKGFPSNRLPKALVPKDEFDGIDLTGYSVISADFVGRDADKQAKELHMRRRRVILVYRCQRENQYVEGVLVPNRFDSSKVRFYKSVENL
jgi:hypothetical protein